MVMLSQLGLVPDHLAVQFVHQLVHRGIQIVMGTFGKQIIAFDMDVAFSSLSFFLLLLFL
jgi:hypothetical protein